MTETQLQIAVCKYIAAQYPDTIFVSDLSGMNLSKVQSGQAKMMRSKRGVPDLFIAEPFGNCGGLFLELKIESPYKLNGELKTQTKTVKDRKDNVIEKYNHLQQQSNMLSHLMQKGYSAFFAIGFDMAKQMVDDHMTDKRQWLMERKKMSNQ